MNAYLKCLDQAEENIRAMYSTVEREVEWCLTDETTLGTAKSITSKINAGLDEALAAIEEQRELCKRIEAYD